MGGYAGRVRHLIDFINLQELNGTQKTPRADFVVRGFHADRQLLIGPRHRALVQSAQAMAAQVGGIRGGTGAEICIRKVLRGSVSRFRGLPESQSLSALARTLISFRNLFLTNGKAFSRLNLDEPKSRLNPFVIIDPTGFVLITIWTPTNNQQPAVCME